MEFIIDPPNFKPSVTVAGTFVRCGPDILLLLRHPTKHQGNTWCVPAGKADPGESLLEAAIRETREETNITINPENLQSIRTYNCREPGIDFIYGLHEVVFETRPTVNLKLDEHTDYQWVTPQDALKLNLIIGEDIVIRNRFFSD